MKAKKLLIALGSGIVLAVSIFFFVRPHQPEYKGVTLSTWLSRYAAAEPNSQRQEAEQAIQNIGTNAVPFLTKWIVYDRAKWRIYIARHFPGIYRASPWLYRSTARELKAENTISAFAILGTNAAPAVPSLAALMKDANRPWSQSRAIYALCGIGAPALPSLRGELQARDPQIVTLYGFATGAHPDMRGWPPENKNLVTMAMSTLVRLAPNPSTNTPAH